MTGTLGVIDPPAPTTELPPIGTKDAVRLPEAETDDFVELFRGQYRRLVAALRLAGAGPAAEDVAQEAFARTYRHWRRVRHGTSPTGYVFRVAFRLHAKRGGVREVAIGSAETLLMPVTPSPEDGVLTNTAIAAAIAKMPPARRSCAVACWLAGMRAEEAATAFGVSAATVRKQLEWARADLTPYL